MIHAPAVARKNTKNVTVHNVQMLSSYWLIIATLCILGLTAYALHLWRRVWQAEQQRKNTYASQKKQLHADLMVLTDSFLTEQMPWAEGCIRIKVILDHYDFELGMHNDYQVLHQVFAATQHIPTHDAWRALSNAEKRPYLSLLAELELQHKAASRQAVQQLRQHLQN